MKNLLLSAALVCAIFVFSGCKGQASSETPIPAADRQEFEALLAAAEKKADTFRAARETGLKAAFQGLSIEPNAAPCPVSIPRPPYGVFLRERSFARRP